MQLLNHCYTILVFIWRSWYIIKNLTKKKKQRNPFSLKIKVKEYPFQFLRRGSRERASSYAISVSPPSTLLLVHLCLTIFVSLPSLVYARSSVSRSKAYCVHLSFSPRESLVLQIQVSCTLSVFLFNSYLLPISCCSTLGFFPLLNIQTQVHANPLLVLLLSNNHMKAYFCFDLN
jgi:hypothetical protein